MMSYNMSKNEIILAFYQYTIQRKKLEKYVPSKIFCTQKAPNPNDDLKKWGMHFLIITKEAYIDGNEENE